MEKKEKFSNSVPDGTPNEEKELRPCVSFTSSGQNTDSGAQSSLQPAVEFKGELGETMELLDGSHQLLAHNCEDGVFIADHTNDEQLDQAALFWKQIDPEDRDTVQRFERIRDDGGITYINPAAHPGATEIFQRKPLQPQETRLHHLESPDMVRVQGASKFAYQEGWLYSLENGEAQAFKLVSADITVDRISEIYDFEGKMVDSYWHITVHSGGRMHTWELNSDQAATEFLSKLQNARGVNFASGMRVRNSLLNFIRTLAASAKTERVLCDSGWQKIDNHMIYLSDGHAGVDSYVVQTRRRISISDQYCAPTVFMQAVRIFNDQLVAGPLLLYALYGLTYRLFVEAGVIPQTVLFLCGPTGCRKTSLAKVLYRIFDDEIDEPLHSFQSTLGALDDFVNASRDGIVVLDDFCPNTGNTSEKAMYDKLEKIIRLFGDGSTRKVLDMTHKAVTTAKVQGGAVVTGEVHGRAKSSLLRLLTVELKDSSIDLYELANFQRDTKLWTTFVNSYISFLENNFDSLVCKIKDAFSGFRDAGLQQWKEGRIAVHYATLMCILKILVDYLQNNGVGELKISSFSQIFETGIKNACQYSADLANEKAPLVHYLESLNAVLQKFEAAHLIAPDKRTFSDDDDFLGYRGTCGLLLVKAKNLESAVKQQLCEQGRQQYFICNQEVFPVLADKGIIKTYKNGGTKNAFTLSAKSGGQSCRLVAIRVETLLDELAGMK